MALRAASLFLCPSSPSLFSVKPSQCIIKLHIPYSTPQLSLNSIVSNKAPRFQLFSAVQDVSVEEKPEEVEEDNQEELRRRICVQNVPWNFSPVDLENLFGECGTVKDVEIIKHKNGSSRGFAFLTMTSGDEARAAIDKFDSFELQGRIIRVGFAKTLKKPSLRLPEGAMVLETRHKIFASNLAWKVRSSNLKEFFGTSSNPVSAKVVFDSPSGRSAGYGFVSFATKEEAEAAVSALDGQELMGRPIRLKISQEKVDVSGSEPQETENGEGKPEES